MFSLEIKIGQIRIMVFSNEKDNDKRCTTISGKAVISSCGGKIALPINSLLDMAQNILATKSYCFLFPVHQALHKPEDWASFKHENNISFTIPKEMIERQVEMEIRTGACTMQ